MSARARVVAFAFAAAVAAGTALSPACGGGGAGAGGGTGGGPPLVCGSGTILVDGPGGGTCVPEGAAACAAGTGYDSTHRACTLDLDACGPGTVLSEGHCVPYDPTLRRPDAEESAEPNDADGAAGTVVVTPAGASGFVLHGCIQPYADADGDGGADPDVDSWRISVAEPVLLDVTAVGAGGLAAVFQVLPHAADLVRDGWIKEAFNLAGDSSGRQVFLPAAGDYDLVLADSRAFLSQQFLSMPVASGGPDACYTATVARLPLPAAQELPLGVAAAPTRHAPWFYAFHPSDGDIVSVEAKTAQRATTSVALALLVNGRYVRSSWDGPAAGAGTASIFASGLRASDQVLVVVDTRFDFTDAPGRTPAQMQLAAGRIVPEAPLGTGAVSTTGAGGAFRSLADARFFPFDVPEHAIVYAHFTFSAPSNAQVVDGSGAVVVSDVLAPAVLGSAAGAVSALDLEARFPAPGRYYLAVFTPGAAAGAPLDVTATFEAAQAAPLALGTPVRDVPLGAHGEAWLTLPVSAADFWIELAGAGHGLPDGDDLTVELYALGDSGLLHDGLFPSYAFRLAAAGETAGRFFPDPAAQHTWLARVSDTLGALTGGASFDLGVARRPHTVLDTPRPGAPIVLDGEPLADGETRRYFVPGTPGDSLRLAVTPDGFDLRLHDLSASELATDFDDGGPGQPESYFVDLPAESPAWLAFSVDGSGPGTFRVELGSSGASYTVTRAALAAADPFVDACIPAAGGAAVPLHVSPFLGGVASDEGLSALLPLPFPLSTFGDPAQSGVQVSSNGWLRLGGDALATPEPVNQPMPQLDNVDGDLAPYWDDLAEVQVCARATADAFTVQWTGKPVENPTRRVQAQVRVHADGSFDFIYGPAHTADGATATIGAENAFGSRAALVGYDARGVVAPGTAITFVPGM